MVRREEILDKMTPNEPYTARELADELGEPRTTVDYHLREMAADGEVQKKKHASNRVTWWRVSETGETADR